MIYWLNGAYGAGKTTVTKVLKGLLGNAAVYDPEVTGDAIRDSYPEELFRETFEEYPLWLELCFKLLKDLSARWKGDIIAPMTLLKESSYEAIIGKLAADGVPVLYFFLDADEATLYDRLVNIGREEPDGWCVRHIPICLRAQREDAHAIHIDTVGRTPEQIAEEIARIGSEKR